MQGVYPRIYTHMKDGRVKLASPALWEVSQPEHCDPSECVACSYESRVRLEQTQIAGFAEIESTPVALFVRALMGFHLQSWNEMTMSGSSIEAFLPYS